MTEQPDFDHNPLVGRLIIKRRLAGLVLLAERLTTALWRLVCWGAFFAGLWMMHIPALFGSWGIYGFWAVFMAGIIFLVRRDVRRFRWPDGKSIDRLLEEASNLGHRPLARLEDRLVNPRQRETRTLWQRSKMDAVQAILRLKLRLPRPVLSAQDRNAVRMLALLTLICGFVVAGNQWDSRLAQGLFPFTIPALERDSHSPLTVWITPPAYTGKSQIILEGTGTLDDTLDIPQGSIIRVRLTGGWTTPTILFSGDGDNDEADDNTPRPLDVLGEKSWGVEIEAPPSTHMTIRQAPFLKAAMPLRYIIDQPPEITLSEVPETLEKGEIRPAVTLYDDYGVTNLSFRIERAPEFEGNPFGTPYEETRAVMTPPDTKTDIKPVYDLTWHPWAGMPVVIHISAEDHLGQTATLAPLYMELPQRHFSHPVARKLIDLRSTLIRREQSAFTDIAYELFSLLQDPSLLQNSPVNFLAIRSATVRLMNRPDERDVASVIEILWDVALVLEEGNLPLAMRNLREAQRELERALANPDLSEDDLAQAMDDFQDALMTYFQELIKEIQKRMAESGNMPDISPEMFRDMVRPQDLQNFLSQLQAEIMSGDRDKARDMLSQLQQFMDRLDPSVGASMPPEMEFMMDSMNEMQKLVEKQQALLDQTLAQAAEQSPGQDAAPQTYPDFMPFASDIFRQWGENNIPPPPDAPSQSDPSASSSGQEQQGQEQAKDRSQSPGSQAGKTEQDALRYVLGQLMLDAHEMLGDIPENMGLAEQAMRRSADALAADDPAGSAPHQEQAIEHLQDAMQDMGEQIRQMMQNMTLLALGGAGQRLDPLGRPMGDDGNGQDMFPGARIEIPDEATRKRAEEILEILRQRSGQREREDYELDYFRRLLRQF